MGAERESGRGTGPGGGEAAPASAEEVVLVAAELRRHARAEADPEAAVGALQRDLDEAAAAVRAEGGRAEAILGHRLLASFTGEGAATRALSVAAGLVAMAARNGTEPWELPALALAGGSAARGSVRWADGQGRAVVGLPAARVESLLREASPGEVVLDAAVARSAEQGLADRGLALRPQKAILSSQRLFALLSGGPAAPGRPRRHRPHRAPGPGAEDCRSARRCCHGRPVPRPLADRLDAGSVLGGRFEIAAVVGSGGMGVVYKARDRELDELVALKVLRREMWDEEEQRSRLKDELRLARRITHPNVLRTHDFGELDGVAFVSMEYVRGVTLRTLLDRAEEPLPFRAALRLARQIAAGLGRGPRARGGAPGHQAGQRDPRRRRQRQAHGLRHRPAAPRGRARAPRGVLLHPGR
jgi:eukaryotic-like serine/threonine-protein kinase